MNPLIPRSPEDFLSFLGFPDPFLPSSLPLSRDSLRSRGNPPVGGFSLVTQGECTRVRHTRPSQHVPKCRASGDAGPEAEAEPDPSPPDWALPTGDSASPPLSPEPTVNEPASDVMF